MRGPRNCGTQVLFRRVTRQERRDANAALDIAIANTHNSPHDEVNKGSPVRSERIGTREGVRP